MVWFAAAFAQQPSDLDDPEVVTVEAESRPDTATERSLDRADVQTFPASSADELLRAMPGLHLSAHGGTGKSFQILLRGFDAEHGSDLSVALEGVPLNEPSNVHGHGYLDLHFLPTVLVDGLDLVKGSYAAADGDFAITGAADYHVGLSPTGLLIEGSGGTDRSARGMAAWRPEGRGPGTFLVAEGEGAVGVGAGRRYQQTRLAAGIDGELGPFALRAMAFGYQGTFESPGVLRLDDLEAGEVGLYGAYPEAGGGASSRVLAIGRVAADPGNAGFTAVGWVGARQLRLDQNFTGYLLYPERGDGVRQSEVAADGGARVEGRRLFDWLGATSAVRAGADLRELGVTSTEEAITPEGAPWQTRFDADARHLDLAGWGEARLLLGRHVTVVPGVRADRVALALRDHTLGPRPGWANSAATVVSPKASGTVEVLPELSLFAAYGRGFRSPEARGIQDGDLAPVMQSDSAEGGLSVEPLGGLRVQATAFEVAISNELVFDHLVGRFLSAGRTRRVGVEAVVDVQPAPWLHLQGDVTFTDGRFVADDTPIPYAPRWLGAAAAYVQGAPVAHGSLSGGLRVWALGPRPLPSGFASRPALVGTLTSALVVRRVSLGLEVDNLFGAPWRDGEFVFPSWFDRGEPRSERKILHVTAGEPFAVRLTLGVRPSTSRPDAASLDH